jgi:hypothetical protein
MLGEQPLNLETSVWITPSAADFDYRHTTCGYFAEQDHVLRRAPCAVRPRQNVIDTMVRNQDCRPQRHGCPADPRRPSTQDEIDLKSEGRDRLGWC